MLELTWDDLADFYDEKTGRTARTQPIQRIAAWALQQPEFCVDDEDSICWVSVECDHCGDDGEAPSMHCQSCCGTGFVPVVVSRDRG